jgi:hypothetical protein
MVCILLRWAGCACPAIAYDDVDNRTNREVESEARAVSSVGRTAPSPDSRQVFAERDQGVGEINKRLDSTRMTAP